MNKLTMTLPRVSVLTCFACAVAWWIIFMHITGVTHEDALITYRYAQNLASGNGFVFNTGQRVLGTTTPLLTLLLGGVGRCLGLATIPLAATLTMALFGILTGIVVYYIMVALKCSLMTRIVSVPLFFGNAQIMVASVGGMETSLVLFCMAASALAFLRRRPMACLLISAVLVLTRPDGVVWAVVMGLAVVFQAKRVPWKAVLAAACVVLPWLAFATWYFGSPLPHSIVAKQAIGPSTGLPARLSLAGVESFTRWYIGCTGFGMTSCLTSLWLLILALGAVPYLIRADRRGLGAILIGYPVVYGLFLYAGKAPHFWWYLMPVSLCAVLLSAPGISELSCAISERLQRANPRLRVGPAIAVALVAGACLAQNRGIVAFNLEYQANEVHTRRAIGLWLRNNTPAESVVAMEAVGYQAFFSQRAIVDLAGLVSPRVVALRKTSSSNADLLFKVLSTIKPDYIVLRSFEVDENRHFHGGRLFETEEQRLYFEGNYMECTRFEAPYPERWGEWSFLTIYSRCREGRGETIRAVPEEKKRQLTAEAIHSEGDH